MKAMQEKWNSSYLFGTNADFIEELYEQYLDNPQRLDPKWKNYFDSLQDGGKKDLPQSLVKHKFALMAQKPSYYIGAAEVPETQAKVWQLIAAYRELGATYADLDPLQRYARVRPAALDLASYDLNHELDNEFYLDPDLTRAPKIKLKDIVAKFEAVYCNKIGFEFAHIMESTEKEWLFNYVEKAYLNYSLSTAEKVHLLQKLTEAEGLERYLHTKFVGQKRFSLEGGESLIPALDRVISTASRNGVTEVYLGMAHRGRLNTLVNITGKPPQKLFDEFAGNYSHSPLVTSG
ncbi:MAG: 2-oxoglutarate dehydrogenase E1 subunit family protein, partial [Burkholderiales bacterium]